MFMDRLINFLSEKEIKKTLYPALIISKSIVLPHVESTSQSDISSDIEKLTKELVKIL